MKIALLDFWTPDFNIECNYFTELFRLKHDVEVVTDPTQADLIIFNGRRLLAVDKNSWLPNTKKIGVSQEPPWIFRVNPNCADVILSMSQPNNHMINFPHWLLYVDWFNMADNTDYMNVGGSLDPITTYTERQTYKKTKFASMIARWDARGRSPRGTFTQYVMDNYKHVDCPGGLLHNCEFAAAPSRNPKFPNTPARPGNKMDFLMPYKFNITFENSYFDYYNTEKVLQQFASGCIPVYWGSDKAFDDFNRKAFIYAPEQFDARKVLDKIIEVDTNNDLYQEILSEKVFNNNIIDKYSPERYLERIENLL